MMNMSEAAKLRIEWNGTHCDHPNLVKEYEGGMATGDYVCSTCGATGWGRNWPEDDNKTQPETK